MRFYYTGAKTYLGVQTNPLTSLGGFISSSPIPNNQLANLFGEISLLTINENLTENRAIVLKNELGANKSGLRLYYIYPKKAVTKLKIAAIAPTENGCDEFSLESLPNQRSSPYYATFYEANASYAEGDMIITVAGSKGDKIQIREDNDESASFSADQVIAITSALTQTTPTIEDTVDVIVAAMIDNTTYTVIKVQDPYTGQFSINFKRKTIGVNHAQIGITSTGTAKAENIDLSGGSDNSIDLGSLTSNSYLGLFFQRSILSSARTPKSEDDLVKDFTANVALDEIEDIELYLVWS